jgi:hypothetical protein
MPISGRVQTHESINKTASSCLVCYRLVWCILTHNRWNRRHASDLQHIACTKYIIFALRNKPTRCNISMHICLDVAFSSPETKWQFYSPRWMGFSDSTLVYSQNDPKMSSKIAFLTVLFCNCVLARSGVVSPTTCPPRPTFLTSNPVHHRGHHQSWHSIPV